MKMYLKLQLFQTFILDRAERHDLKSRILLLILLFFFPLFLGGKRKGVRITKVVFLSHTFLLDLILF